MIAALLAEGSSDKALMPILRWLLGGEVRLEWIDTTSFPRRTPALADKVRHALIVCPCDLLFVHRDADKQPPEFRYSEIKDAARSQKHVAIVPVRAMEAWLLLDEAAIRAASGRVSGKEDLGVPPLSRLEFEPEPKERLYRALKIAHGGKGRRATRFHPQAAVHRVADLVTDWSPLRRLAAFRRLEQDTKAALSDLRASRHH